MNYKFISITIGLCSSFIFSVFVDSSPKFNLEVLLFRWMMFSFAFIFLYFSFKYMDKALVTGQVRVKDKKKVNNKCKGELQ